MIITFQLSHINAMGGSEIILALVSASQIEGIHQVEVILQSKQ